jgi:hypothetical protein
MAEEITLPLSCPKCGAAPTGGRYCSTCGQDLAVIPPPPSSQPQPAPSVAAVVTAAATQPTVAAAPQGINGGLVLALVAGGLIALGSFLPWITATAALVGTLTRSGLDSGGDGLVTLGIGIGIAVAAIIALSTSGAITAARVLAVLLGIGAVVVGVVDIGNVNDRIQAITSSSSAIASVGMGLYAVVLGGVIAVIGGLIARPAPKLAPAAGAPVSAAPVLKRCPRCAEDVKIDARVCRFCSYQFTAADDTAVAAQLAPPPRSAIEGGWRVAESSINGLAVGATAAIEAHPDMILVGMGHQGFAMPRTGLTIQAADGVLRLSDGKRSVALAPLENQSTGHAATSLQAQ